MNGITTADVVLHLIMFVFLSGSLFCLFYFLHFFLKKLYSFLFSNKPIQESTSESIQKSNAEVIKVYRTRPYKRYSYDGGSVKRSHRFYANDLKFINKIAESKNVHTSDVVNSMIGYFIENPELINVIASDFKKDKPLPAEKEFPKQ